jgi:hypothetical protein
MVAPWEVMPKVWERPLPISKTSMAGPLGGDVGDPGALTIQRKNVDDKPPGRRCRKSESVHHLCQRCR